MFSGDALENGNSLSSSAIGDPVVADAATVLIGSPSNLILGLPLALEYFLALGTVLPALFIALALFKFHFRSCHFPWSSGTGICTGRETHAIELGDPLHAVLPADLGDCVRIT